MAAREVGMGGRRASVYAIIAAAAWIDACGSPAAAADDYQEAVHRAVALLPRRPVRVFVVDRDRMPAERRIRLLRVEGYMAAADTTVYLVRQGEVLRHAVRYRGAFDYALAAIIWHEMAHIDGADEAGARRDEERLWRWFVIGGQVDHTSGMAYLAKLTRRR